MGEIIWVVVSGTALVSERGPGRVFGDWKGAGDRLLSSFFGPSWGARSALRCLHPNGLVIAFLSRYSIWLWERIIALRHRSCVPWYH